MNTFVTPTVAASGGGSRIFCIAALAAVVLTSATWTYSSAHEKPSGLPPQLHFGKKWRIVYYEGGPYVNYRGSLEHIVLALMDMGWIEKSAWPDLPGEENSSVLWDWMSTRLKSDYLEFIREGFWSAGWDSSRRGEIREQILSRISRDQDVDLILAAGTWAGEDLVPYVHNTPIMVFSTADPVRAGIIMSPGDSGRDNVHAWCDPTRIQRRLELFHDLLNFKKLGLIYEDTPDGLAIGHLEVVRETAARRGFEVAACVAASSAPSPGEIKAQVGACVDRLARRVDAFLVTDHRGLSITFLPEVVRPFMDRGVVTFSPVVGPRLVRRGVVMGIARADYASLGYFYAAVITKIFHGIKPRDIEQVYKEPLGIALNAKAAELTGYRIPPNLRKIADPIFDGIE
ncbi:MAG: ABC transporter substrate binding protein [Pseudomonadota bacterium]